ncbi:MAG: LemA family protein [Candidatus Nanohaloarchaea archaeon]|nr:LemA family protein [Candidatus Nanohaloarchaea archaeon]
MVSGMTMLAGLVGIIVVVGLLAYVVMIYNGLVRLKRNIEKAWSNIDVLLKQRRDEIPKLIDTAKQYMDYERDVLQNITEKREQAEQASSPKEKANAESALGGALGNLFARAEDYPDLKANKNFQQLQERISSIEEQIADRREFYNDSVNTYNIRINQIPYNIVANLMGYQDKELFEASEQERQDVDIASQFNS